jgi:hypothetical protein
MPVFHVEMRWRCSACQQENLGRFKDCQMCRKPKDGEPFYDAPEAASPTLAQAVQDEGLIRQATAGADWSCKFCGSHQRRDSGLCGNCGADQDGAARPAKYDGERALPQPAAKKDWPGRGWAIAMGVLSSLFTLILFFSWVLRTREVQAEVVARSWEHKVVVERYKVVPSEGFERPSDAFDVVNQGQRFHHNDKVQDGTTREAYTERVACGQECTTTPTRCTTNNNGFKTCTGGDQKCSTKYCSETRYRDVPRYKDVPVYRDYYSWKAWRWAHERDVIESGVEDSPRWPTDSAIALEKTCAPQEKERAERKASYRVVFKEEDGSRYEYAAETLEQFESLELGEARTIRVTASDEVTLVPK